MSKHDDNFGSPYQEQGAHALNTFMKTTTIPDRPAAEYSMNHKERGLAIIFNNKTFEKSLGHDERLGTDADRDRLRRVLKALDFTVITYNNPSHSAIVNAVKTAAAEMHKDYDCLVVCILSHGELGYISASDTKYKLADICQFFAPDKCPNLAGKPKLFFVQACQGNKTQGPITMKTMEVQTDSYPATGYKIPLYADFLIAYSTIPGYISWRRKKTGSWFIQSLCDELEINGRRLDLMTLLTAVCRRVAISFETWHEIPEYDGQKQMPFITSMLTRVLLFRDKPKKSSNLF